MKSIQILIVALISCSCISVLAGMQNIGFYNPVEKKTKNSILVICAPPGKKAKVAFNAEKIQIEKIKRLHVMPADEEGKWIIQFVMSVKPTTKPLVFIYGERMYGVSQDNNNAGKEKNIAKLIAVNYVVTVESKKTALEIKKWYTKTPKIPDRLKLRKH